MAMFDGLYTYEIAILIAGAVLFVVLIVAFLRQLFTNRPYQGLLAFFVLPIGMMGFPAITSFQIKDGTVEIDKTTHDLQSKPQDPQTRASLEGAVAKLASRPIHDPRVLTTIARAQFALGQDNEAESNLDKVLTTSPNLPAATELKTKIELTKNLTHLTTVAAAEPDNSKVKEELQGTYSKLAQQPMANPKALEAMSKAKTLLGKSAVSTTPAK